MREDVGGLTAQIVGKDCELHSIPEELRDVRKLFERKLIQFHRVTALERDTARRVGERCGLFAWVAQANHRIAETELPILKVNQDMSIPST